MYFDFNEKSLYEKINYNFKTDNDDDGHGNIWGGIKITNYIGEVLKEQFGIKPETRWQWEETNRYYKEELNRLETG